MALAGVELGTLVSETDVLTTRTSLCLVFLALLQCIHNLLLKAVVTEVVKTYVPVFVTLKIILYTVVTFTVLLKRLSYRSLYRRG